MVINPTLKMCIAPGMFLAVVGAFTLVVWRASNLDIDVSDDQDLPVVKAASGPVRIRPDTPGGLQVPHQDKTVFDTFENGNAVHREEKLLSRPDEPMVPSYLVETGEAQIGVSADAANQSVDDVTTKVEAVINDSDNSSKGSADRVVRNTDLSVPKDPEEEKQFEKFRLVNSSFHVVQLASFRSLDAAEVAWEKLYVRAPRLLSGLSPTIVQANLINGGGTFYRLQAGPLPDRDAAAALCKALGTHDLDCLIVQP